MKNKLRDNLDNFLAVFIILLCAFVAVFLIDYTVLADRITALSYAPSETIVNLTEALLLTERAQLILAASQPSVQSAADFQASCPIETTEATVIGCYANNKIYIYDISRTELDGIMQSTLAHELLHAAWDRLSATERKDLGAELLAFYNEHQPELLPYVEGYEGDKLLDELHSLIGTSYASTGSIVLDQHYDKYFKDRSNLASFFSNYHSTFQALNQKIETLYNQIVANQAQLSALTTNYTDAVTELNSAIEDFNKRASSGAFTSLESFESERNLLLNQQTALDELRRQINNLSASTNVLIAEYNDALIYTNELLESVDSRLESPPITIGS